MEYTVMIHHWYDKHCSSLAFKFNNQIDALRFANDITDRYYGIEKIDVAVSWRIKEK